MSKKNKAILISAVLFVIAAVTACIVFRKEIAAFVGSVKAKFAKPAEDPRPDFTQEEIESFADI